MLLWTHENSDFGTLFPTLFPAESVPSTLGRKAKGGGFKTKGTNKFELPCSPQHSHTPLPTSSVLLSPTFNVRNVF